MTDAPATIWATGNKTTGSWNHTPLSLRIAPVQTEYVRADIAASQFISVLPEAQFAAFAAAVDADVESPADTSQARIAQLEAALECVLHYVNTSGEAAQKAANEIQDTPAIDAVVFARAALKAKP
jgi:hypothetical protein